MNGTSYDFRPMGGGKTYDAVQRVLRNPKSYLLVFSEVEKRRIVTLYGGSDDAKLLRLSMQVIALDDANRIRGLDMQEVTIDNLSMVLRVLLNMHGERLWLTDTLFP